MKTFQFLSAALLSSALFVGSVSAKERIRFDSEKASEAYLHEQISQVVSKINTQNSDSVSLLFNISEEGEFELLKVNGQDQDLVSLVTRSFRSKKLDIPEGVIGQYRIKLRFVDKGELSANF